MKKNKKFLAVGLTGLAAFALWTLILLTLDVKNVGVNETALGLSSLNTKLHSLVGTHLFLYELTDVLSLIPIFFVLSFALLGLCQLVKRKSIFKVDKDILVLGAFLAALAISFLFFEKFVLNYQMPLFQQIFCLGSLVKQKRIFKLLCS